MGLLVELIVAGGALAGAAGLLLEIAIDGLRFVAQGEGFE